MTDPAAHGHRQTEGAEALAMKIHLLQGWKQLLRGERGGQAQGRERILAGGQHAPPGVQEHGLTAEEVQDREGDRVAQEGIP